MDNYNILKNDNKYLDNRQVIISVQENERQRIARDLHDASLQTLTHMVHQLELCELYMDNDISKAKLEILSIQKNLKTVMDEIRNVIFDLRPMSFDDLGLKQSYENFFDTLKKYCNIEFDVVVDDIKKTDDYFLLSIYRIGRECIMNSIRHSKATKLVFRCIEKDNNINMYIEDNGIGFSEKNVLEKKNHYGLTVIYERVGILNGSIHIDSTQGTKIEITIPIN